MVLYYSILAMVGSSIYLLSDSLLQMRMRPHLRFITAMHPTKKFSIYSIKALKPLIRLTEPIGRLPYMKKLKTQTEILKINMDLPVVVLLKVFLAIIAGMAVTVLLHALSYAIVASLLGFFVPDIIFISKMKGKKQAICRVFPEMVDLIDLCIGAGLDFTSSLRWIIEKTDSNAFIEQLSVVLSEIQVGRNRSDALKDMAKRLQLAEITSFARTVVQSERMGTSVEEAFRNLSEDTRLMRYQSGERIAIKASLKILMPLLFCILPVILIIVAGPIIIKFTEGELIPKAAF